LGNSVVSGNNLNGLRVTGTSAHVFSSYFGTDRTGSYSISNTLAGILIDGSLSTIGPVVASGNMNGIAITGDLNQVVSSAVGTNRGVTAAISNSSAGVFVSGDNNHIGGDEPGNHSYISGNATHGVSFGATASGNTVANAAIGLDLAGTTAIPNGGDGVFDAGQNTIGEVSIPGSPAEPTATLFRRFDGYVAKADDTVVIGTVISGNTLSGIRSTGTTIVRNSSIGTNYAGTMAIPNGLHGIYLDAGADHVIGGSVGGQGNIISGNASSGIYADPDVFGDIVAGNLVGTNGVGEAALGNGSYGMLLSNSFVVGGTTLAERNIVSGNGTTGIGITGSGNEIYGNTIGLDNTATYAIPNLSHGISLQIGSSNTTIGGNSTASGNVISGNGINGIGSSDATVQMFNNRIGTDGTGTVAVGNGGHGVEIFSSTAVIGGPNRPNIISGNGGSGIFIESPESAPDRPESSVAKGSGVASVYIVGNKIGP